MCLRVPEAANLAPMKRWAIVGMCIAACTTSPSEGTETLVELQVGQAFEDRWHTVHVEVFDASSTLLDAFDLTPSDTSPMVRLHPLSTTDARFRLDAELRGSGDCGDDCRLAEVSVHSGGFLPGDSRIIRLRFDGACERDERCPLGTTCTERGGEASCAPRTRAPSSA